MSQETNTNSKSNLDANTNDRSSSPAPPSLTSSMSFSLRQPPPVQYRYSNVFRQLFDTLESEHRKLQALEQRRQKLTQEMQSLREMLQQESQRLRQNSPVYGSARFAHLMPSSPGPDAIVLSASTPPPPPPTPPPPPPPEQFLNRPSTSNSDELQQNRQQTQNNPNFLRKVCATSNHFLGATNLVDWDNELEPPQNQEEFNEIVSSLPPLLNFVDPDDDEIAEGGNESTDALSLDPLRSLPPNPPPSESESFDVDQSMSPKMENEITDVMDDALHDDFSKGYGHLHLIHPVNPPHSGFNMPLTNLSSNSGQLDNVVPNVLNIPAPPPPPPPPSVWQLPMSVSSKKDNARVNNDDDEGLDADN